MIQRLRSHLTYANVMVTILAFVVLGGGTALASFVVSSNSQIGPNTVSGHKPPTGDHANVIGGSVNGTDLATGAVTGPKLATGSVTGAKVANDSLTGADVNESSLTGNAQALIYNDNASVSPPLTTIATVGPYAIKGQCVIVAGASQARLSVNGPGTADVMFNWTLNDTTDEGTRSESLALGANTDTTIASITASSGNFDRIVGTAMLRTGSTLVQVDFDIVPDGRSSPGTCSIYGTATRAT